MCGEMGGVGRTNPCRIGQANAGLQAATPHMDEPCPPHVGFRPEVGDHGRPRPAFTTSTIRPVQRVAPALTSTWRSTRRSSQTATCMAAGPFTAFLSSWTSESLPHSSGLHATELGNDGQMGRGVC